MFTSIHLNAPLSSQIYHPHLTSGQCCMVMSGMIKLNMPSERSMDEGEPGKITAMIKTLHQELSYNHLEPMKITNGLNNFISELMVHGEWMKRALRELPIQLLAQQDFGRTRMGLAILMKDGGWEQ